MWKGHHCQLEPQTRHQEGQPQQQAASDSLDALERLGHLRERVSPSVPYSRLMPNSNRAEEKAPSRMYFTPASLDLGSLRAKPARM